MKKLIYLDNSAATRIDERILDAMNPYFTKIYSVATSEFGYSLGLESRDALNSAREKLSAAIGASADEFIFTSGSTESSNMAIKGIAINALNKNQNHLVISKIEDFPVLYSARSLKKSGFKVTELDVDEFGFIDLNQLEDSINEKTALVSIQHANQEIGTVQDIKNISKICKMKNTVFHTDATHTFGRIPINTVEVQADLITLSAHTIHGPRGTGGLFVRKGTELAKWMDGGFQEFNLRAGIENIAGAVGFAKAIEIITPDETERIKNIRENLTSRVLKEIPDTLLNGHDEKRLPQNANITFHYIEGESVTLHLDMRGFAVSTGSACFSKSLEASHVIMAIGGNHERAHGSIRFSIGRYNTMPDIDSLIENLSYVVKELRKISPLGK